MKTKKKTQRPDRAFIWRMQKPCGDCPFSDSRAGTHLRESLHPERLAEIEYGLLNNEHFICHETTEETGNNTNLVCAGAIAWQDARGVSGNYVRICERLEGIAKRK